MFGVRETRRTQQRRLRRDSRGGAERTGECVEERVCGRGKEPSRAPFEGVVLSRGAETEPSKGRVIEKGLLERWELLQHICMLERKRDDARRNHRRNRVPWDV